MRVCITSNLVAQTAQEGAAVPFTVQVWDDSTEPWVAATPTTLRYRLDDPERGCNLVDWTTVTPASSATITITGAQNTLTSCLSRERRQLVVEADHGLSTNAVSTREFWVRQLAGVFA